jgi:hypothetical protein
VSLWVRNSAAPCDQLASLNALDRPILIGSAALVVTN